MVLKRFVGFTMFLRLFTTFYDFLGAKLAHANALWKLLSFCENSKTQKLRKQLPRSPLLVISEQFREHFANET